MLEGVACPYDPDALGRSFRFWVRLDEAEFEDDRKEWDPIARRHTDKPQRHPVERIWILYPDPAEGGFGLTAQYDTLSGILRFSGKDYDFQLWDHATRTG